VFSENYSAKDKYFYLVALAVAKICSRNKYFHDYCKRYCKHYFHIL